MPSQLINLTQEVWTQITTSADGIIRHHEGKTKIVYVVATSIVAALDPATAVMRDTIIGTEIPYSGIPAGSFIWAYAISGNANVVVTSSNGASLSLDAGYFNGLAGVISQTYTEANSKLGTQHEASALFAGVAGLASNDTIFITGALPLSLKGRVIGYSGLGVTAEIFRGPTYTGGTAAVYQNASDINPVTGLSQIITGATVTATGTLVFAPDYLIGNASNQGKGDPGKVLGRERLLRRNTTYLLRLTSLDTQPQNITSLLSWYEGELDLPRL